MFKSEMTSSSNVLTSGTDEETLSESSSSSSSSTVDEDLDEAHKTNEIVALIDTSRSFQEPIKFFSDYDSNNEDDNTYECDDVNHRHSDAVATNEEPTTSSHVDSTTNSQDSSESSSSSSLMMLTTTPTSCKVKFDTVVSGIEIASHRDYDQHDRRRLWNSFEEIQMNAERNINEFRADGWEWREATEESDMLLQKKGSSSSNDDDDDAADEEAEEELVHPASYKRTRDVFDSPKSSQRKNRKQRGKRQRQH